MKPYPTLKELEEAVRLAIAAAQSYYNTGQTLISDAEYDHLIERIEASQSDFPNTEGVKELLTTVAAGTVAGGDVEHSTPMLSLKKVKTLEEVQSFESKVKELGSTVILEPKLDGVALAVRYVEGNLHQAITRGDGVMGKDVTHILRNHSVIGLPRKVDGFTGEVRGEVYMTTSQFQQASAARIAHAEAQHIESRKSARANKDLAFDPAKFTFANSRNAVSGLVNRDDDPGFDFTLSFAAYDVSGLESDSYLSRLTQLEEWGITPARSLFDLPAGSVLEQVEALGEQRQASDVPTDGSVIKAESYVVREQMGVGSRHPRHSVAYKYESEEGTTTVLDIETDVGRTGRLSLRARVEPVEVDGTTITYASLHNPSWLMDKDIRVGSTVKIKRANDVIPQVSQVVEHAKDSEAWTPPASCPQCGHEWDKSTLLWRCMSPECGILGSLVYAVSRDALDIDEVGPVVVEALVDNELVADVADLFTLSSTDLETLEFSSRRKMSETVAQRIHSNIQQAAQKQPFARILTALGLRGTGRSMSRILAAHFKDVDSLLAASIEDLNEVESVGRIKAELIHSELKRLTPVIEKLRGKVNLAEASTKGTDNDSSPLEGKKVVITGSMKSSPFDGKTRTEMQELIESYGGKTSSSVSSSTSMLVCETGSTSSKFKKAQSLGVDILTPAEFADLLGVS